MRVAVIINPMSGARRRADVARQRAELAAASLHARGIDGEVFVTERPGHARELAQAAIGRGAGIVAAWGGDGTMNEVASALAFSATSLGIIPSGSGNGLARELKIPLEPRSALDVVLEGSERTIDAGELDGRLFFNIAGVGLDAFVARRFASPDNVRRGFVRYVGMTLREVLAFTPAEHTIVTERGTIRERILLVAIANGRQYGNGALVAPDARADDGQLDVVVIASRAAVVAVMQMPQVFTGKIARVPGVTIHRSPTIEVSSGVPLVFHVDGEPHVGGSSIRGCVHPGALKVRVPARLG